MLPLPVRVPEHPFLKLVQIHEEHPIETKLRRHRDAAKEWDQNRPPDSPAGRMT